MDFGPTTQQFDTAFMNDALPSGTRLGGYQIVDVLGRGGFGIVYLALDASLQRQVAIKEYLPAELAMRCDDGQVWVRPGADAAAYSSGMNAFLNEAKMLARFDHPSLARVLSFWEENRSAYMVMPFYEGKTLARLLADMPRPPDEAWLRSLLAPLLSALSTLHNAQCLHLDISPDNIIVMPDGRPVLLDFGVASRLATDKTIALTALLNPAYAPIEQYSESPTLPQGPWSDLYALASVLHFAIAGVPPARATVRAVEDPQRPMAEVVQERAKQFPGLRYSDSFLAGIDKALAVKPRDRPRSAADFSLLLDRVAPRPGAKAAPVPPAPSPSPSPAAAAAEPAPGSFAEAVAAVAATPTHPVLEPASDPWFAAEPTDAPPRRRRNRAPLFIATVAALGLAGVAGWAWVQRQPSLATITVADLPAAVVAKIPKPAAEGASGVPLESAAASEPLAVANAPAATMAAVSPSAAPASAAASPSTPAATPVATVTPAPTPTTATAVAPAKKPTPAALRAAAKATRDRERAAKASAAASAATASADAASAAAEAASASARNKRNAKVVAAAPSNSALTPEPATPRAACGSRSNFALVYCMQQQCKRWKFNTHPQCLDMERRGEL